MQVDVIEILELELKYCERCGGLWLRPRGEEGVYCPPCLPKMAEFPQVRVRRRNWAGLEQVEGQQGSLDEVFAICCEGGHA